MTTTHTFDTTAATTTTIAHDHLGQPAVGHRRATGVVRRAALAGVAAAAVNLAIAAVSGAAGVSFEDRNGDAIPLLGFPQVTLMATIVGVGIAVWCARRSARPRHRFVSTAVALTLVSLVPPLLIGLDAASVVMLEVTHLAAAAIVIPAIASRLRR